MQQLLQFVQAAEPVVPAVAVDLDLEIPATDAGRRRAVRPVVEIGIPGHQFVELAGSTVLDGRAEGRAKNLSGEFQVEHFDQLREVDKVVELQPLNGAVQPDLALALGEDNTLDDSAAADFFRGKHGRITNARTI